MTGSARKPSRRNNVMASKIRTQIPRPPSRKRKASVRPVPPRPKGELERLAVRRRAAMQYRLAGASYRSIAAKLTEDRANAYADANGISVERAMKQLPHVSKRTVWDDVTAELEELWRETEDAARGPDGARERPVGSGVLEGAVAVREWQRAGWPTGYRDDGTALPDRCRYASRSEPVFEVSGARFVRGVAFGSESVPRSLGVGHSACSASR